MAHQDLVNEALVMFSQHKLNELYIDRALDQDDQEPEKLEVHLKEHSADWMFNNSGSGMNSDVRPAFSVEDLMDYINNTLERVSFDIGNYMAARQQSKLHVAERLFQSVSVPFAKIDLSFLTDTSLISDTLLVECSGLIQSNMVQASGFINIANLISDNEIQVQNEIDNFSNDIQIDLLRNLYRKNTLTESDIQKIQVVYPGINLATSKHMVFYRQTYQPINTHSSTTLQAVTDLMDEIRLHVLSIEVVTLLQNEYKKNIKTHLFPTSIVPIPTISEDLPF